MKGNFIIIGFERRKLSLDINDPVYTLLAIPVKDVSDTIRKLIRAYVPRRNTKLPSAINEAPFDFCISYWMQTRVRIRILCQTRHRENYGQTETNENALFHHCLRCERSGFGSSPSAMVVDSCTNSPFRLT